MEVKFVPLTHDNIINLEILADMKEPNTCKLKLLLLSATDSRATF